MTTAFVLGGARNLGAVQVGMLRALLEREVVPDLVVGCSVGALNGAALAADPTLAGVGRLEALWLELRRRDLWPGGALGAAARLVRSAPGSNAAVRSAVARGAPATFEELAVPFACVAASLATGQERWFTAGPLAEPVLASAALPGLLPPVEIDGEPFIDGAAVNTVPLRKAVELGADRLVVLQIKDLSRSEPVPVRPIEVLARAFAISRNARFLAELASLPPGVSVDLLPVPDWPRLRYDGFSRTPELIAAAHRVAAAHLDRRD